MEQVLSAGEQQPNVDWLEKLVQFNTENANEVIFGDRYGQQTKYKFVSHLLVHLKSIYAQDPTVAPTSSEVTLVAILTALRLCLREPSGIAALFDSTENFATILALAGLLPTTAATTTTTTTYTPPPTTDATAPLPPPPPAAAVAPSLSVQAEASKCLVNLVAKNKTLEHLLVEKYNGALKIVELLHRGLPNGNIFPLLRILLHISLPSSTAVVESIRSVGMHSIVNILQRCFPPPPAEIVFDEFNPVPTEALKVAFNLTLALGPLATGKGIAPTTDDITIFHQLQPIYVHILSFPLPPLRSSFLSIHNYILQLKLSIVNCLLNTPKGQFQSAFGFQESNENQQGGYMQPLSTPLSSSTLKALLDILALQTQVTNEKPSEALVTILMLLTTLAQEVVEVREVMKLFLFPQDILDNLPDKVGVEIPTSVQQSAIASKLIPLMSSLEPALKHYVNEFFYIICDEDANEVCRITGFGNAAGLLVMRGLMNVPS